MIYPTWFTIATNDDHPMNIDRLKEHCYEWAYIRHDDPDENQPHTHFVGHMAKNSRQSIDNIAKWAELPVNMVQVVRSVAGILDYFDHHNEPEKVQYSLEKVVSNFDFQKRLGTEKAKIGSKNRLREILGQIDNDTIVEYNLTEYLDIIEYTAYKRQIDLAFRYKNEKGAGTDRDMEVWYIHGKTGSGKTTLAKFLCKQLGYAVYIASAGRNPFDDYQGQPAVILDDARPSDWKFNDFLKLTDNNTSSMVGCRFYNKHFYRCKLLIVTNCDPLENWYTGLQEHDGEALGQLTRRFTRNLEIKRTDKKRGTVTAYDSISGATFIFELPDFARQCQKIDLSQFGKKLDTESPDYKKLNPEENDLPW